MINNMSEENQQERIYLADLQERRKQLEERLNKSRSINSKLNMIAWALPIVSVFVGWLIYEYNVNLVFLVLPIIYFIIPLALLQIFHLQMKQIERDIQELDFEIDLQKFEASKHEQRAEKLFRMNALQLNRYYDLNIGQNSWVFGLGIFCIVLGIAVVGVSLFLVIKVAQTLQTQIITASLGAIGTILSNFVAVIYLKMNSTATENLKEFHSRLVETQQFLLGNLFASRIDDNKKREETLSQLSLYLMQKEGKKQTSTS